MAGCTFCLLALGLLLGGCGGSDDTTTPTLSKAQFVKQAQSICNEGRNKALVSKGADPVQDGVLPAIELATTELAALGVPSGDEGQVKALVQALEEDAARATQKKVASLPEFEDEFEDSAARARKYGVPACAYA